MPRRQKEPLRPLTSVEYARLEQLSRSQSESAAQVAHAKALLAVWTEDEAGPFPTVPFPGNHWQPEGEPVRYPHEYLRAGTAKQLTLFHPASGEVRVKGVRSTANAGSCRDTCKNRN